MLNFLFGFFKFILIAIVILFSTLTIYDVSCDMKERKRNRKHGSAKR